MKKHKFKDKANPNKHIGEWSFKRHEIVLIRSKQRNTQMYIVEDKPVFPEIDRTS